MTAQEIFGFQATETQRGIVGKRVSVCEVCHTEYTEPIIARIHQDGTVFDILPSENCCPVCQMHKRDTEANANYQRQKENDELERLKENASIPPLFFESSFGTYICSSSEQTHAVSACKQYAENNFRNLIVCGPVGTGKTHLACATLNVVIHLHKTAKYVTEGDIYRMIRNTYGKRGVSESDVIRQFMEPDYLAIDEIARTRWSDAEKVTLTDLIDKRYYTERHTIFVTNLPPESFTDRSGETHPGIDEYLGAAASRRMRSNSIEVTANWRAYAERQK